jgi:hypothetical protein
MKLPLLTAAALTLASARAGYSTKFTAPPYALDQTVIGTDGWSDRLPTEKANPDTTRFNTEPRVSPPNPGRRL